ncbi:MAG: acyltransferase [Hyphomonadaceae bacterium]
MFANVQALRALAAIAVLLHHLQAQMNVHLGTPHLGYLGRAGVDVFFAISGFIMFHTTRDGGRTIGQFWRDRILRIVPLYWAAMGVMLALLAFGLHPLGIAAVSADDVLAHALFIPDVRLDGDPYPIVDVGWTLNYEMYFYVLFGLTFLLPSQAWALATLTAFFLAAWWIAVTVTGLPHALKQWAQPITLEFVAGGALALLYRVRLPISRTVERVIGTIAITGGAVSLVVAAGWMGWLANHDFAIRALGFGLPSVAIVGGALLLERSGVVMRGRVLLLLGAASYAIYLVHHIIVQFGAELAELIDPHPGFVVIALDATLISFVAIGAGIAVHVWIEKPVTQGLKRYLMARRSKAELSGFG